MDDATSTPTAITDLSTTQAVIRLDHLRHNVRVLRERAGEATLMGVVKADAYGHGAARIAEVLREEGIHHLAVARVGEALQLRGAGLSGPILVLGAPLPAHLPAYAHHRLDVTVSSHEVADAVIATARTTAPLRAHVKVDTGMGRIGLAPDAVAPVVRRLQQADGVELVGLWTHLATADRPDDPFTQQQLDRFDALVRRVGSVVRCVHIANSSALLNGHVSTRSHVPSMVRIGIALYGLANRSDTAERLGLRPVMQLTAQVVHVKTVSAGTSISYGRRWTAEHVTRIATLGAGYGDGYDRLLSNRAEVNLKSHRVPVVGAVCMDMCMVDLGPPNRAPDVAVGDTAVLFGPDGPSAFDVAAWTDTIPYEVCTRVTGRVPRVYHEAP